MASDFPAGLGPNDPTAGDRAYTDHTDVSFTLKEGSQGQPWIMIEEELPGLPILKPGDAFLGLRFRDEVSFTDAQRFTSELRRMIDSISYTKFIT